MTLGAITRPVQQLITSAQPSKNKSRCKPCTEMQRRQIDLQREQIELRQKQLRLQKEVAEKQKWLGILTTVIFGAIILGLAFPEHIGRMLGYIVEHAPIVGNLINRYRQRVALRENTTDLSAKAQSESARHIYDMRRLPSDFTRSVKDTLDRRQSTIIVVPDKSAKQNVKMQLALEYQMRELNQAAIAGRQYVHHVEAQIHTTLDAMAHTNEVLVIDGSGSLVVRSIIMEAKRRAASAVNPNGRIQIVVLLTESEYAELHEQDPSFIHRFVVHVSKKYPPSEPNEGPKGGSGTPPSGSAVVGGKGAAEGAKGSPGAKRIALEDSELVSLGIKRSANGTLDLTKGGWRVDPVGEAVIALQQGKGARGPQGVSFHHMSPGEVGRMVRDQMRGHRQSSQLMVDGELNMYALAGIRQSIRRTVFESFRSFMRFGSRDAIHDRDRERKEGRFCRREERPGRMVLEAARR